MFCFCCGKCLKDTVQHGMPKIRFFYCEIGERLPTIAFNVLSKWPVIEEFIKMMEWVTFHSIGKLCDINFHLRLNNISWDKSRNRAFHVHSSGKLNKTLPIYKADCLVIRNRMKSYTEGIQATNHSHSYVQTLWRCKQNKYLIWIKSES